MRFTWGAGPLVDRYALTVVVDRDRGVVAVRDRPDDVLGTERRVAAEIHAGTRRRHRHLVDDRHVPFVELDARVALDPRERVFLADGDQHVVAWKVDVRLAGRDELPPTLGVLLRRDLLERHAGQLAAFVRERLGHEVVVDRDALVHRVFLLPRRRLHFVEAGAHDDLHFLAAQAARRTAAVHGRVAATEHDHALADARHVAERNGRQPVDADVDVRGRFTAPGNVEVAPARRAAADEHGVPSLGEQLLSCCRCAGRRGIRCQGRARSPLPRRSRNRAGGTSESASGSCRRPARRRRRSRIRSRAAPGRAPP